MKKILSIAFASMALSFVAPIVQAADVSAKGVHLCCGACAKAVATALGKVDGVTDAACDREAGTVTFKATDAKTARGGLVALARAGFYGKSPIDGKETRFPGRKAKEGTKSNTVALRGVHLCCGGCAKAAAAAVKGVKGVESVTCDNMKRTVMATGTDIDVAAAVAALNKAGFSARTGGKKKKKQADK